MAGINATPDKHNRDESTPTDSAAQAFDAEQNTDQRPWHWLAWLPIPLLLVSIVALSASNQAGSHESPHLLLVLNFAFSTLVSLFVAYLIGRSYMVRSTPGLLMLGCGVLLWGAAFVVAAIGPANPNFTATVHNLGVWLSAVCNLVGAALLFRPRRTMPSAGLWLGWAYTLASGALGFVVLAAHAGWTPVFFVQGQGGTPVRQLVLGSAVTMLVLAAILLRTANRKSVSAFEHWYPYALGLMAVGLLGVLIQSSLGSWLSWAGRAAQYLGGVYMLIAAIASVQESHVWGISLEAALQESEERYRTLFNTMEEGFCIIEVIFDDEGRPADYRFLEINAAFAKQTGLHDARGKRMRELAPAHEAYWFEIYGKIALTGEPARFVNEARALDRWYDVHAYRVGKPEERRVAIVFNDITEQKRAEEILRQRQSESVFATLADFVPQIVWMCTPDGLNVYFNQRWVEHTGLTLEESYGRGWNTPFHPDDKQAAWNAWNHAVQTGKEYRVESRLRAADGTYRWFLMRGAPLRNVAGEIVRWFGTCTDIEELKQAEQTQVAAQRQLTETVVNQLPCCVALVRGRDLTFQLVNPGYQSIFPGREILGKSLPVAWPDKPGFEELCRRVLETGASYEAVDEPTMVSRYGGGPLESAYFSWSIHRVDLPKEDGWGLLITGWETTGRKQTEQALLRSEKLASLGRMAATIAHEINNPLEAVTNLLFVVKSLKDPESTRQYLEMADEELKRIAHITRQSLGFYRESNAPTLTSVNAVMKSAVDLLKNKINAKDAVIEQQWDGDVQVTAVAGELRQVFCNLLANSLDAIDQKGSIKLRISTGAAFKNDDPCVRITVADSGIGISPSSRQHLFEPFFTTKGTVGTGLGLWVSKQIIEKHGGTIQMRSSTNGARRGTAFSIVLPVDPAVATRSQSAGA